MTWTVFGGDHTCPTCNAVPAQPCTSRNGLPLSTSHAARFRDQQATSCSHCGRSVIPGLSATGWVHETDRRVRCDGLLLNAAGRSRTHMAAAS